MEKCWGGNLYSGEIGANFEGRTGVCQAVRDDWERSEKVSGLPGFGRSRLRFAGLRV